MYTRIQGRACRLRLVFTFARARAKANRSILQADGLLLCARVGDALCIESAGEREDNCAAATDCDRSLLRPSIVVQANPAWRARCDEHCAFCDFLGGQCGAGPREPINVYAFELLYFAAMRVNLWYIFGFCEIRVVSGEST